MRLCNTKLLRGIEELTRRLSSVRSTATPASTLPTVRETSIARKCGSVKLCCDNVTCCCPGVAHHRCPADGGPTFNRIRQPQLSNTIVDIGQDAIALQRKLYITRKDKKVRRAYVPLIKLSVEQLLVLMRYPFYTFPELASSK